ncbi:hypothetical protein [Pseudoalteromonas luteoviolacea]|uniref:hypothetical protein n=1 Tax=Pseudoalteromonas luteoviolacea TaxID=43657 RepID=UPI001B36628D|nr:hypothetical protein [Pseudoalteromonas luteoviolacea]MBQ4835658.1 hypothetical protein [Pseudoalteromonas luteoviolacea]
MRKLLIAPLIGILSACGGGGGGGSNNSEPSRPNTNVNQAPTIALAGESIALSKESITLTTQFRDPEQDTLTVNWKSSLSDVTFQQNSLAETVISFPTVTEKQSVVITCEVSDGVNPTVTRNFNVTLYPETIGAQIEMLDEYQFKGESEVSINVPFKTTSEIEEVSWSIENFEPDHQEVINSLTSDHGDSTLKLQLPSVSEVLEFYLTITIKTKEGVHNQTARVKVSPADGPSLTVSLPQNLSVSSKGQLSIVPTISNSDEVTSYQWLWEPNPQPTDPTATKKIYQFIAPNVEQDTDFTVSLNVTMKGDVKQSATTQVKVKSIPAHNTLTLTSSHEIATVGQTVIIKSDLEDTTDVKSIAWDINNGFDKAMYAQEHNQLTIEIPPTNDVKKYHTVSYTVEYNSGVVQESQIPLVYLSKSAAENDIKLADRYQEFSIYPQREVTANYTLTSSVPLDDVRVVSSWDTYTYDKLEAKLAGDNLAITVLKNEPISAGTRFFKVLTKAGAAEKEFSITAQAYDSLLRAYSGVDEVFIAGRSISVFGQLLHADNKNDYIANWASDTLRFEFVNAQSPINTATMRDIFRPESERVKLILSSQDENNTETKSELAVEFVENLTLNGEVYDCKVKDRVLQQCTSENGQVHFSTPPEQLKQVVTRGSYVCLLGYDGTVQCDGFKDNPALEVPNLEPVARLNAVDTETVCAQFANTSWQCWGSKATKIEDLIKQSGQVHQILSVNDQTCLVSDGQIHCYQGEEKVFESAGRFVSTLLMKDEKICYKTKRAYSANCPLD